MSLYLSTRLCLALSFTLFADPAAITGIVVDAGGRALPRAHVRVLTDADERASGSTFTDGDGLFRLAGDAGCRLEASLPGFATVTVPCSTEPGLRIELPVAPVSEAVVVSATRTEVPAGQLAGGVTVFTADELDRRRRPLLADVLRSAPGVTVVRTGAPGGVTSLFVRGGESNYTKVLLDGVPLNEPGGTFDVSNLTTDNLDRVEFVRGANSALFGSDAMTGVVQLFTRRGTSATPAVHGAFEAGSFDTVRAGAGVGARTGAFDYTADVTRLSTDNDVPNSAFDDLTLSGTAGARLPHDATLRFIGRLQRSTTGTPGQTAFGRPDLDAAFERHDGEWGVTFDQTWNRWRQRGSYGSAISHQDSSNLIEDPAYTPAFEGRVAPFAFSDFTFDNLSKLRRDHATYQSDWSTSTARYGTHIESALIDWDGERATLIDVLSGTSTPASRNNVGLTFQHQALWARAFVTAGIRYEHNASFGDAGVPRIAATYILRASNGRFGSSRITGSAGRGIKEPTLLQSFSQSPFFLGNPDLQPERSRTLDVGFEQRLMNDRVRVDFTVFANRYRDIISTRTTDPATFASQYFNIGLTRARGIELAGDVALTSGFRARAGYTLDDSKILESTSEFSTVLAAGNQAFRRPRHSGYTQLAWIHGRGSVDLTGTLVGARVDSDFSSLEPPIESNDPYQQWDLRASVSLTRQLSITGAVDNLFDRDYLEPLGYEALGRAARIGARVKF